MNIHFIALWHNVKKSRAEFDLSVGAKLQAGTPSAAACVMARGTAFEGSCAITLDAGVLSQVVDDELSDLLYRQGESTFLRNQSLNFNVRHRVHAQLAEAHRRIQLDLILKPCGNKLVTNI